MRRRSRNRIDRKGGGRYPIHQYHWVWARTVESSGEQDDGPVAFTSADDGGEVEEQAHVEFSDEVEGVKKDMVALVDEQYAYSSAPLR
jgi:hypothetical protein